MACGGNETVGQLPNIQAKIYEKYQKHLRKTDTKTEFIGRTIMSHKRQMDEQDDQPDQRTVLKRNYESNTTNSRQKIFGAKLFNRPKYTIKNCRKCENCRRKCGGNWPLIRSFDGTYFGEKTKIAYAY